MRPLSSCFLAISAPEPPVKGTILVVEDDDDTRNLLVEYITEEHYRVIAASNSQKALEAVKSFTPQLLLLDYNLPLMTGVQLAECLHMIPGLEQVPTLMMSATKAFREKMAQYGLIGLQKPFDLSDLLEAINNIVDAA